MFYTLYMRRFLLLVAVLGGVQLVFGCAARRESARALLPTADTVCIVLKGVTGPGAPFVMRKAALHLSEQGFHIANDECDVTATYTNFNKGEWEVLRLSLFGTRSTNACRFWVQA